MGRRGFCGAWYRCRWGGRGGTESAGVGDLLVRQWSGDGLSWSPQRKSCGITVVESVLLQRIFPELLPAGAAGGPLQFDWWQNQSKLIRQRRPSSARTSSSEDDATSTDEEDHLLTQRCIERQWTLIFSPMLMIDHLTCDHTGSLLEVFFRLNRSIFNSSPG